MQSSYSVSSLQYLPDAEWPPLYQTLSAFWLPHIGFHFWHQPSVQRWHSIVSVWFLSALKLWSHCSVRVGGVKPMVERAQVLKCNFQKKKEKGWRRPGCAFNSPLSSAPTSRDVLTSLPLSGALLPSFLSPLSPWTAGVVAFRSPLRYSCREGTS